MKGRIVAIEGGDGAGKRTTAEALVRRLSERRMTCQIISFPRYGKTIGADVIGNFLADRISAPVDPRVLAVFYAADRFESIDLIKNAIAASDFVIMDRYIGSNVAYQGAKVSAQMRLETMKWIEKLELELFGLPPPCISILLQMPIELSKNLVSQKEQRSYTTKVFDRHEADDELQKSIRESYSLLVSHEIVSPWLTINPVLDGKLRTPTDIADEILNEMELLVP